MKARRTMLPARRWLSALAVLIACVACASAQSGRVFPTPEPTPTPAPAEPRPKFTPAPGAERFKLVFPTSYEQPLTFDGKKWKRDGEANLRAFFDAFVKSLNEAGALGYRHLTSADGAIAIMELSDAQHEYAWFETKSEHFFIKSGFFANYSELSRRGFRLVSHHLLYGECERPEDSVVETCVYKDYYLLEREKGAEGPRPYRRVDYLPRWGGKPGDDMTAAVAEGLAEGFRPTVLLSSYEMILEPSPHGRVRAEDVPEVRIVRAASFWGGDNLPKKVNELARQGFRLSLVNNQIAVMYRKRGDATPTSYAWLKVGKRDMMMRRKKRNFEKELAKLLAGGAVYRMVYPAGANGWGDKNQLIFEQAGSPARKPSECRMLRLETKVMNDPEKEKVVQLDLTAESKEAWREFNRLVAEGFAVRDLFVMDEVYVLLERSGQDAARAGADARR